MENTPSFVYSALTKPLCVTPFSRRTIGSSLCTLISKSFYWILLLCRLLSYCWTERNPRNFMKHCYWPSVSTMTRLQRLYLNIRSMKNLRNRGTCIPPLDRYLPQWVFSFFSKFSSVSLLTDYCNKTPSSDWRTIFAQDFSFNLSLRPHADVCSSFHLKN